MVGNIRIFYNIGIHIYNILHRILTVLTEYSNHIKKQLIKAAGKYVVLQFKIKSNFRSLLFSKRFYYNIMVLITQLTPKSSNCRDVSVMQHN